MQGQKSIFCPPAEVDIVEVKQGQFLGHSGSPVQAVIDDLVGKLGEQVEISVAQQKLDELPHALQLIISTAPLFPDEIAVALKQVRDDVLLCIEGDVIQWSATVDARVEELLLHMARLVQGSWLVEALLHDHEGSQCEPLLGLEHVPRVRAVIGCKSVTANRIVILNMTCDELERTQIACLLEHLSLPLCFAECSAMEVKRTDAVMYACVRKGEAVAEDTGRFAKAERVGRPGRQSPGSSRALSHPLL